MDKKENNVVFYGPLPVSSPCPIIKPNDKIQLPPTVHPVAIAPYITMGGEDVAADGEVATNGVAEVAEEKKVERRMSARISGVIMLLVTVITAILFIFSAVDNYPVAAIAKYADMSVFFKSFEVMFATKQFTQFELVFVPYLIAVAAVALLINLIMSVIAVLTGRRRGYALFAFIAFLTLVIAAFYQMNFFSDIKNIGNLLSREDGWASLMLIIIGVGNLVAAFVCAVICPKHYIEKTVEF